MAETRNSQNLHPARGGVDDVIAGAAIVRSMSGISAGLARTISKTSLSAITATFSLHSAISGMQAHNSVHSHSRDIDGLCKELGNRGTQMGMTAEEAHHRWNAEGPNELYKEKAPGFFILFLMQLTNFIIILLIVAGAGSIVVNATSHENDQFLAYVEGLAIFIIVIINAGIAALTENSANNALEALSKMSAPSCQVIRDGKEQTIQSSEVVRGDVIVLGTGDIVPADMRLITAEEVKVNEMVLTGEAEDVNKFAVKVLMEKGAHGSTKNEKEKEAKAAAGEAGGDQKPASLTPATMVFTSTLVTSGKATGVVTKVGMNTRVGKIAAMLVGKKKTQCGCLPDTSDNMTPMQVAFQFLGVRIGYGAVFTCLIVFAVGVFLDAKDPNVPNQTSWMYMILVSVTLAVAAIPEGIPLCTTISLSFGCSAMVQENVLVRRLAAVETLGSASVICSDKTGTLTEGKMTMVKMWAGKVMYNVTGKGFDPTNGGIIREDNQVDGNKDPLVVSTIYAGWLCSNCKIVRSEEPGSQQVKWSPIGNSSEAPITVAAGKLGLWDYQTGNQGTPADHERQLEIPFTSSRKMMMTIHDVGTRDTKGVPELGPGGLKLPASAKHVVVVKGAPNMIIEHCTKGLGDDGREYDMTTAEAANTIEVIDSLSDQALRVLAVAYTTVDQLPYKESDDLELDQRFKLLRKNLTLIGLVASQDPEREGVKEAIDATYGAYIRVVMITGDYVKTAIAIARKINILRPEDDTSDLANINCAACDAASMRPNGEYLPQHELDRFVFAKRVVTRAQPEDKMEIIHSLQRQGLVVAMTGDGVNDAPALNAADIGVAMGIQGTEVAKGASDMILIDDNFCSIVKAVEKGRIIYAGIQKFVAFIMSVHIGEVVQIFVCICANIPVMRTPLQILFLILVTDLPPSIALGMEVSGASRRLKERPRPKNERLVLPWMWIGICMNGAILSICALVVYCICLLMYIGTTDLNEIADRINFECGGTKENPVSCPESSTTIGLTNSRTAAFICVVWCENFRAYVARSFHRPVWEGFFNNKAMQKAIFMAQVALYVFICVPYLSTEIMRLNGPELPGSGWGLGISGAVMCLFLCEIYKINVKRQIDSYHKRIIGEQEREQKERDEAYAKLDAKKAADANGHATNGAKPEVTVQTQRSNGYNTKELEVWNETLQL
jgi:potassium/sodium efflux P-type ATPase